MTAEDPCCVLCESSAGVCRSKRQCAHHKIAEKQLNIDHRARQTYNDPTSQGRNGLGTPHPSFTYSASIDCAHWRETTVSNRGTYCQCMRGHYYRIYCVGCEWWTPVADGENEAAELLLDHCWPGWRELPTIETKQNAKYGYDFAIPDDYPTEWQVPGAPIKDCRGNTKHGLRHVPSGSPWGGYKTAVVRECKQHTR